MNRRSRGRLGAAFLGSALLHAGVVALFWASATRAAALPEMRVYAVDIVSPPPRESGEPTPEPEAPADDEPEMEPEPEQEPVEAEPEPQPEPAPAPPTRRTEPERPKPEPPPEKKPEPEPRQREQPREPPKPPTGRDPDPSSAGGENLDVRVEGARFVDPAYLANIQRQLNRYFRPPASARADQAEVFFRINRDGSVTDIRLVSSAGSFQFRLAAIEAVERAGGDKAFGRLPEAYPADQLAVSFYFRPAR